jgi:uncharacterized protein (UPF0276 family)
MSWPLRHLGHGIGLRTAHFPHIVEHGAAGVDWFEVISENFFEPGGRPWAVLDRVRREAPVVLHGVSLGIGNSDALSEGYLSSLAELARRIEPAWISDHLCWGGYGGHYAHDLLPLPYSEEALAHVVARVERVQERLGRQILLENVSSYVAFRSSTLSEWEFLAEVARRADCGILLDVNNVLVSAHNHGFSAEAYVDALPIERIGQLHLAGHTDTGTYWFDSHVGPVPPAVWALHERVVARAGPLPTLVEWDEAVPPFEVVAAESRQAAERERRTLRGE